MSLFPPLVALFHVYVPSPGRRHPRRLLRRPRMRGSAWPRTSTPSPHQQYSRCDRWWNCSYPRSSLWPLLCLKGAVFFTNLNLLPGLQVVLLPPPDSGPPVVRGQDRRRWYRPGDNVRLECAVRGADPTPNITWFINGEKVKLK